MADTRFDQIGFGSGRDSTTIKLPKSYGSINEFLDDLRRSSPTYQALVRDIEKIDKEMEKMKQKR